MFKQKKHGKILIDKENNCSIIVDTRNVHSIMSLKYNILLEIHNSFFNIECDSFFRVNKNSHKNRLMYISIKNKSERKIVV